MSEEMERISGYIDDAIKLEKSERYLDRLVGRIYKILPMWEKSDPGLVFYLRSLRMELEGNWELEWAMDFDPDIMALKSILSYFIAHPFMKKRELRSEVFHAIGLCKQMKRRAKAREEAIGKAVEALEKEAKA